MSLLPKSVKVDCISIMGFHCHIFCSEIFAQAGLVNGSNFYILPGSGTANISLLTSTSNIGQEGAWLFRISEFASASMCFVIYIYIHH